MLKKFLKISNAIIITVLIIFYLPFGNALVKENKLSLQIVPVENPFNYEDYDYDGKGFIDTEPNKIHPPVLVNYNNQKSLLFFLPANENDSPELIYIYNFNLANQKLNVVGTIFGGEIISVFGYESGDNNTMVLMLTKNTYSDYVLFDAISASIIEEDGGLYIVSSKVDRISLAGLDPCIDSATSVCKYKDAASIKKFFDKMNKN